MWDSFTKSHHDVPYVNAIVNAGNHIPLSLVSVLASAHCNVERFLFELLCCIPLQKATMMYLMLVLL